MLQFGESGFGSAGQKDVLVDDAKPMVRFFDCEGDVNATITDRLCALLWRVYSAGS